MTQKTAKCLLLVVVAGGVLAPPTLVASDYLLFTSERETTRGRVYHMDSEGNLTEFNDELDIGYDTFSISVSPDGRLVIFSAWARPRMTLFFLSRDGSFSLPLRLDNHLNYASYRNPIQFHPTEQLFYVGYAPVSSYNYSTYDSTAVPTGYAADMGIVTDAIGYSRYATSLVFMPLFYAEELQMAYLQTIKANFCGEFGDQATSCTLLGYDTYDLAVSPNGRWAAVPVYGLKLVRIEPDGAAVLVQDMRFPLWEIGGIGRWVKFTPDGRHLLMLSDTGEKSLMLLELNESTGRLAEYSWINHYAPGWLLTGPHALALTPDGRFAVFASWDRQDLTRNFIHVVRIHDDGTLEYLNGKEVNVNYIINTIGIAPFPQSGTQCWTYYE